MGFQARRHYPQTPLPRRCLILTVVSYLFLTLFFDVGVPTPAMAIPTSGDYRFQTLFLEGTFTSDGTKMTVWNFTSPDFGTGVGPITWSSADLAGVRFNNEGGLFQENGRSTLGIAFWPFPAEEGGGADIFVTVPCDVEEQCGGPTFTTGNIHVPWIPVPEATTNLLLGLGLISLVGFQWGQYCREPLQKG